MRFEAIVALRHLRSGGAQTLMTVTGVAMGVALFVFLAALLNGLQARLIRTTIGNASHITLTEPEQKPRPLIRPDGRFTAEQMLGTPDRGIDAWRQLIPLIEPYPGIVAISPSMVGGGFIRRGDQSSPVTVRGVPVDDPSAIVDLRGSLKAGELTFGDNRAAIGLELADRLGLDLGQSFRVVSQRGLERQFRVTALYRVGLKAIDEGSIFVGLEDGQALLGRGTRIDQIEIKIEKVFDAAPLAGALERATGLKATTWLESNSNLLSGLKAQSGSGQIIKGFTLIAVAIGISGVLMVSVVRRRGEIGIMRSFGVHRRSVIAIFLLQGLGIACAGALLGIVLGLGFSLFLQMVTRQPDGSSAMPIDPSQGEFLAAFVSATLAGAIAGILPARAAAKVDPAQGMAGQ